MILREDQGLPFVDSAMFRDSGVPTPPPDAGDPNVDRGIPMGCQKRCTDQAAFLCVEETSTHLCVECLTDSHCVNNSGAAGTTCDKQSYLCECSQHADCVGKIMGAQCHANDKVCSCISDADCTGDRLCIGLFFGTKVCKPRCYTNADCASNMFETVCDTEAGCMECVQTSDCGPTKLGNTCTNGLCSCSTDSDCSNNINGRKCLTEGGELCGCENDLDCPDGTACTGQYMGNRLCQ